MIRKTVQLFICLLIITNHLLGQWKDLPCIDTVYDSNIFTAQLRFFDQLEKMPLITLNQNQYLTLTFDDFSTYQRNIEYTVVHCTRDWQPTTTINTLEYIKGFTSVPILPEEFSYQTINQYIHYREVIPNKNIQLKLSGNYLLVVYDADEQKPLFTKRFMILDTQVDVSGVVDVPIGNNYWTHQEVTFEVKQPEQENLDQREITATILKNRNWHTAYTNIAPRMASRGSLLFDYLGKMVFQQGNEFRWADLRNIRITAPEIVSIQRFDDGYEVNLLPNQPRREDYFFRKDINGDFLIDTEIRVDGARPTIPSADVGFRADYLDVFFSISYPHPIPEKVYITGAFSNWELSDTYEMQYNEEEKQYEIWLFLKQGYYNYAFVTKEFEDQKVGSWDVLEGNFPDTQNDYQILIYYRPFGGRYDQLIGFTTL